MKPVLQVLSGQNPIILKRTRELSPPRPSKGLRFDIGTVSIVAYCLPKSHPRERAILSRALWQSPALKIGRCLYMFPYVCESKLTGHSSTVISAAKLCKLCATEGIDVHLLAYMRIVYPAKHDTILQALADAQLEKANRLLTACRGLAGRVKEGSVGRSELNKVLSALRSRYRLLKGVMFFLKLEMGVDLSSVLRKVYSVLRSCEALAEAVPL
jgi:hypothetical protein